MSRPVAASLLALTLFLAVLPLTLDKPGMPAGFKADEAAYYMMALSLAHDGDLRMDEGDVTRVFQEFPFGPVDNLIVMTDDAWHSVYYGKPYLYSLFAAPFAGLAGANGMLCFNMLLHLGMVWLGTLWLGRFNPSGLAALFSAGFFFLSAGFAYVFWLQPEVFNMAAVAVACFAAFYGLAPGPDGVEPRGWTAAAVSGAALALAAYNKPVFALLAVALVWRPLSRRRWGQLAGWAAGFAASLALAAGLAVALTGHPTPYLGVERMGVTVCEPGVMPVEPRPIPTSAPPADRPTGGAWSWIFRVPRVVPGELVENLGYFLWGRHTGLMLYLPFGALAGLLFLLHGRRRGEGWALAGALAAIALFFLVFIPQNWQGGGGFVGNRYFVNVYPALLFLATRVSPAALVVAGWGWAGLFLGPLVLTPFGRNVPEPTLQSHVRGAPFRLFPLELSLREVPGYADRLVGGRRFTGRRDVFLPLGDRFWLRGATDAELWITGERPIGRAVFVVSSPAAGNRVRLELGDAETELVFDRPGSRRVELEPGEPDRVRTQNGATFRVYRMEVEASTGRIRHWTRHFPPNPCPYFATNESWEESFFLGAELTYLGDGAGLEADVYGVEWLAVEPPARLAAGEEAAIPVRLRNASDAVWEEVGGARVRLAYRWLRPDGTPAVAEGERTELPLPVAPGAEAAVEMGVRAPAEPGSYRLVIDPVFEHVAWFSDRGAAPFEAVVEVTAAGEGEPEAGWGDKGSEAGVGRVMNHASTGLVDERLEAGWEGERWATDDGSVHQAGGSDWFADPSASDPRHGFRTAIGSSTTQLVTTQPVAAIAARGPAGWSR